MTLRKFFSIFMVCALATVTISCHKDGDDGKGRTVLCYMVGGSLSGDIMSKLNSLKTGYSENIGNLLVYCDNDYSEACLLRLKRSNNSQSAVVDTIKKYGYVNSSNYLTFREVVNTVKQKYKSDSYGLIIFGHGSGWLPENYLTNPRSSSSRSIFIEGGSSEVGFVSEMNIIDMAKALDSKSFDFILFEPCLMGGVEVAYELKDKCNFVLFSSAEIVRPGYTSTYATNIMDLLKYDFTAVDALKSFGQAYYDYDMEYARSYTGADPSITLSIIDMAELDKLGQLAKPIFNGFDETNTLNLSNFQNFDGTVLKSSPRYLDLEEIAENVSTTQSDFDAFKAQLEKTVVWKRSSEKLLRSTVPTFYPLNKFCGLSVYVMQSNYPQTNIEYKKTAWYQAVK